MFNLPEFFMIVTQKIKHAVTEQFTENLLLLLTNEHLDFTDQCPMGTAHFDSWSTTTKINNHSCLDSNYKMFYYIVCFDTATA